MTAKEAIQRIRDADNWTDDFFKEVEPTYLEHFNTIRNTLVKDGLWSRFDTAFSEWKKPGQAVAVASASQVDAEKKAGSTNSAVCDKGKFRKVESHNLVFFVKHFSLKKASEFPVFIRGFSLLLAGNIYASLRMSACSMR